MVGETEGKNTKMTKGKKEDILTRIKSGKYTIKKINPEK